MRRYVDGRDEAPVPQRRLLGRQDDGVAAHRARPARLLAPAQRPRRERARRPHRSRDRRRRARGCRPARSARGRRSAHVAARVVPRPRRRAAYAAGRARRARRRCGRRAVYLVRQGPGARSARADASGPRRAAASALRRAGLERLVDQGRRAVRAAAGRRAAGHARRAATPRRRRCAQRRSGRRAALASPRPAHARRRRHSTRRTGEVLCTAQCGDLLLLRPLLLHRSGKAESRRARRVLHFVFGPAVLPGGVAWAEGGG